MPPLLEAIMEYGFNELMAIASRAAKTEHEISFLNGLRIFGRVKAHYLNGAVLCYDIRDGRLIFEILPDGKALLMV
jgi:hypothetical protein